MAGPDHVILLGLDGGDDVTHPPGAAGPFRIIERIEIEHVVVEPGHHTAIGVEVTAAGHAVRARGGRAVERPRGSGPPVDQQRLVVVVLVEDPQPADVQPLAAGQVEPAEAQAAFDASRSDRAWWVPLAPMSHTWLSRDEVSLRRSSRRA